METTKALLPLALLALLSACGGGSDALPGVAGTWRGTLTATQDMCGMGATLQEVEQVAISGTTVTVTIGSGKVLTGAVNSDGFTAQVGDNAGFAETETVAYSAIANGSAKITLSHIWNRPGGCVSTWTGTMRHD